MEGDADLEDGSALFSPAKRCAGGRDEASAPSCGVAAADEVSFSAESFSDGAADFEPALPSSFGVTAGAASPAAVVSNVCGVVVSVASLVLSVTRLVAAPALAPARARVLPLPRGFGGIGD